MWCVVWCGVTGVWTDRQMFDLEVRECVDGTILYNTGTNYSIV